METSAEEKKLTFGMVTRVLKLSKLQIRTIFSTVLRELIPAEEDEIGFTPLVVLTFADLLENIGFLVPEQRAAILTEICPDLLARAEFWTQFNQIVFVDSQFCTWTGKTGFLDLITGECVQELPHPAMETIGYNLNELYRRQRLRIEKRSGFHVKKHNAGSVDESGNIRVGLADNVHRPIRIGGSDVGPDNDLDGN